MTTLPHTDDISEAAHALQIVRSMPALAWSTDAAGRFTYVSPNAMDFMGVTPGDLNHLPDQQSFGWRPVVHPHDYESIAEQWRQCMQTGDPYDIEHRLRRADGVYCWVRSSGRATRDKAGNILSWHGVTIEIERQKRVEAEMIERERFLWQMVETLPAMIDCAAPDGEPIYRSQKLREFLGFDLGDLDRTGKPRLAATLETAVHADDLSAVKEHYARSLATGEPYARRHRLRRFDGEYRWVETRAAPMHDANGAIVQWNVICLDIDGEVRSQEELRQTREGLARASQAASLAELSASIAHEVNQPLTAIVAHCHACLRWLTAEPPNIDRAKATADQVIRDANSAAEVVARIRALFSQSGWTRSPTGLGHLVAEVHRLIADEAQRRAIRVDLDIQPDLPAMPIDHVQVQQVLFNLVRNGMEAMDRVVANEKVLSVRAHATANHVRVEISDAGPGIEFPDRIFEPIFTTKHQGMGMGLAICRSIVESHGGRLWGEADLQRGTTFVFTLPIEAART